MARWLFKEEPSCYGFDALERDGSCVWDGVTNALALKHLRAVRPGDEVFFYHTGDEKAVVGVMAVVAVADSGAKAAEDIGVKLKPVRRLAAPVTLAAIKADPDFADWELVRIGRLSVMPVSDARWAKVEQMARGPAEEVSKPPRGKQK